MSEELRWEIDFSLNPFNFAPSPLRRLFVIFGEKKKNCSRHKISLPLGSLCRQPLDGFFLFSLSAPSLTFYKEGQEAREPRPGTTSGCISAPLQRLPTLLEETGAHMADRAPSHADPVPPRLYPPCEGRVPRSSPHYLRSPPESGPGLASPGPPPSSLGPGLAAHPPTTPPRLGLRSPGSPCRTASSAPPPTCCLPQSGLPPGPSEPEGPRKRQVSGRHQPPARLSGPLRHRLRRPQASSARPGAASDPPEPARPGYYMATAHFRCRPPRAHAHSGPRQRTRAPCRRRSARTSRLLTERPPRPMSGPERA